jgi:hypothetical protein
MLSLTKRHRFASRLFCSGRAHVRCDLLDKTSALLSMDGPHSLKVDVPMPAPAVLADTAWSAAPSRLLMIHHAPPRLQESVVAMASDGALIAAVGMGMTNPTLARHHQMLVQIAVQHGAAIALVENRIQATLDDVLERSLVRAPCLLSKRVHCLPPVA